MAILWFCPAVYQSKEESVLNIRTRLTALLLSVLTVLSVLPVRTFAATAEDLLDFSNPNSTHNVSLSPSELLSLLTGEAAGSAEVAYADAYFEHILVYYDRIPSDCVLLSSDGGELNIVAKRFSYTAENGQTVLWVPSHAVYDGNSIALSKSGSSFVGTIPNIAPEIASEVGIVFSCELTVPKSVADALARFAYTDAEAAKDLTTAEEYTEALAKYQAYLSALDAYEDAVVAYEIYLSEYAEYENEKAAYDQYCDQKKKYDEDLAAYEQYEKDQAAFEKAQTEYREQYAEEIRAQEEYLAYLNRLNAVRTSMYAMESLFLRPSSEKTRPLYDALQNQELVNMFEKYRDTLVSVYGVSDATLSQLRSTSDTLNEHLRAYAKARKTSEEAAFSYYAEHYETIRDLFNYLYGSMREIMSGMIFNHICAKMELEYKGESLTYKKWRVKNMLAHIYLICLCLDDEKTADGIFSFYSDNGNKHTYYFTDLLDQNLILTDTNTASPKGLSYPAKVEPVTLPEPPKAPDPVGKPVPPPVVLEPTEPTRVEEPTPPTPVDEVGDPTEEDLKNFEMARRTADIVAAYKNGSLPSRAPFGSDRTVTLSKTVTRAISFGNAPMVTFYNGDGSVLLSAELNEGDTLPLPEEEPSLPDDAQYRYTFAGWSLSPDSDPNTLGALPTMPDGDLAVYAVYFKTKQRYTVTVKLDKHDPSPTQTEYDYGEMPILPASPQKEMTRDTVYTFIGWSPSVSSVTQSITYTAQYMASARKYSITWNTPTGSVTRSEVYGANPAAPTVYKTYYEGCTRYDFLGWSPAVSKVTANAAYTAEYRATLLASTEEGTLTLSPSAAEYRLSGTGAPTSVKYLFESAQKDGKRIVFDFSGIRISVDTAAVSKLRNAGVATAALITDTAGGVGIGFYDASGAPLSLSEGLLIALPYSANTGGFPCVLSPDSRGNLLLSASTAEGNTLRVAAVPHKTYRVSKQFSLSLVTSGGVVLASGSRFLAGESIPLTSYPQTEHILSSIELKNDETGETVTLSSLANFVMPAYHSTLTVTFVPRTYTVSFVVRGEVISSAAYRLGDTVTVPEVISDFEENGYRYTFIGWSSPIGAVTGDAVYTAKFYAIPIEEAPTDDGTGWAWGTVLWQIVLPAGLFVLALSALTVCLIVRHRRKKKKRPNQPKRKKD